MTKSDEEEYEIIGHKILIASIFFVFCSVMVPFFIIVNNIAASSQEHNIWWLQPYPQFAALRADEIDYFLSNNAQGLSKSRKLAHGVLFRNRKIARKLELVDNFQSLAKPAFCSEYISFPFQMGIFSPDQFYLPWVFDAVFSPDFQSVNIVMMDSTSCSFSTISPNNTNSLYVSSHVIKDRRPNNITGSQEIKSSMSKLDARHAFTIKNYLKKRVSCRFYDIHSQLIGKSDSLPILEQLIRCPLPPQVKKSHISSLRMRLALLDQDISKSRTEIFGVCSLPKSLPSRIFRNNSSRANNIPSALSTSSSSSLHFSDRFHLTVCTSVESYHVARLVEWIEYHRALGVEHFFIYDRYIKKSKSHDLNTTSLVSEIDRLNDKHLNLRGKDILQEDDDSLGAEKASIPSESKDPLSDSSSGALSSFFWNKKPASLESASDSSIVDLETLLADYIDASVVTVVSWPYKNCYEDSSSCAEDISSHDMDSEHTPMSYRLQHYASMASCFQRFRHFSDWLMILDDHKFIGINSPALSQPMNLPDIIQDANSNSNHLAGLEITSHSYLSCENELEEISLASSTLNASSISLNSSNWGNVDDEEGGQLPPRLSQPYILNPNPKPNELEKTFILHSSSVLNFDGHRILHVVNNFGDSDANTMNTFGDMSKSHHGKAGGESAPQNHIANLGSKFLRLSHSRAGYEEFSIAKLDSDKVKVLDLRSNRACSRENDGVLTSLRKQMCIAAANSTKLTNDLVYFTHSPYVTGIYDNFRKRFSSSLVGNILPIVN